MHSLNMVANFNL